MRFKIFKGTFSYGLSLYADTKMNEWLEEHPSVEVVDWKYRQVNHDEHSICIMYKERNENEASI